MNSDPITRFPNLFQMFAGYFHQDWQREYAAVDKAIDAFIDDSSLEDRRATLKELDQILDAVIDDSSAEALCHSLGLSFSFSKLRLSALNWLGGLRNRLASTIG